MNPNVFLDKMHEVGITDIFCVPCSFLTNLINAAMNDSRFNYHQCANEGVACSLAAGVVVAGGKPIVMMQSSGVGNSASCISSMLVPYGIHFPIISSWRTYKNGDSEIQHKVLAEKLTDLVDSVGAYTYIIESEMELIDYLYSYSKLGLFHIGVLCNQDLFESVELNEENKSKLPDTNFFRSDYLKMLNNCPEYKFFGTTGNTAREMYTFMPDTDNFYQAGNMGNVCSVAAGYAYNSKNPTIALGGDAEFFMHLGGLATSTKLLKNIDVPFCYIVFNNRVNKSTGNQYNDLSEFNFDSIASSLGLKPVIVTNPNGLLYNINVALINKEKLFICINDVGLDEVTPRPPLDEVTSSFRRWNNDNII